MSRSKKLILIISTIALLAIPIVSQADQKCNPGVILPKCICSGNCDFDDFVTLFIKLANWGLTILGGITVILIMWSAWGLMTSAGNPEKIKAGQQGIINTLLGLFFVLAAWSIVNVFFILLAGRTEVFNRPWYSQACPDNKICTDISKLSDDQQDDRLCKATGKCPGDEICCLNDTSAPCPGDRVCTDASGFSESKKASECKATLKCPGSQICCDPQPPCPTGQTCTNTKGWSVEVKTAGKCQATGKCPGDKYVICCNKPTEIQGPPPPPNYCSDGEECTDLNSYPLDQQNKCYPKPECPTDWCCPTPFSSSHPCSAGKVCTDTTWLIEWQKVHCEYSDYCSAGPEVMCCPISS